MRNLWVVLALAVCPAASLAEVVAAGPGGFSLRIETPTKATPAQAYDAFIAIERWWDPDHSYTGKAENLSLDVSPGGAFLERLDDGGFVVHLSLVYASPGRELRFVGGLGPLQGMGLDGTMTVRFEASDDGSKAVMLYNVSGFAEGGLEGLAPIVDQVQAGQMARFAAYADSRR